MASSVRNVFVLAATAALLAVACGTGGGGKVGGTVHLLGVWSGSEQDSFFAVLKPFQDSTGIKVEYESTRDLDAILTTRVSAGSPPDVASAPNPTLLASFAKDGKVKALDGVLDMTKLKAEYDQSWIDLGTVNGKLYQVFAWAAIKGLVWYDPKNFTAKGYKPANTWDDLISLQNQIKNGGTTPWCIGVESGAASGWAGSDWVKELVLSGSGPQVSDNWRDGKQKWSSPEIKSAWTAWGTILGPGDSNVYGGKNYILSTNFGDAGNPMFQSPPKCYMHHQASFITDFFVKAKPDLKAGDDFNFFPLPSLNKQYDGAHVVAGDTFSMFKDTPQARELIKYLVTAEAQSIWVKRGGKISPNKKTNLSDYPDSIAKATAQALVATKIAKYDAGDLMPNDMKTAYWKAVLDFVSDQTKIDSILAGLDKVQATAYK